MIKTCCFCSLPVLGVPGQDTVLDSYHFKSTPEDQRAIAEKIFGDCHLSCFVDSPWSDFCSSRCIENLTEIKGFEVLFKEAGTLLLRHPRSGDYVTSPSPGVLLFPGRDDVRKRLRVDDGAIGFEQRDRNWDIQGISKSTALSSSMQEGEFVPLMRLVESFGISDRLYDRRRALEGKLVNNPEKTARYLQKGILVATLQCTASLPVVCGPRRLK